MEKEIKALSKALEDLLLIVLSKGEHTPQSIPAPVAPATPAPAAPVVPATPAPAAPVVPATPAPVAPAPVAPAPVAPAPVAPAPVAPAAPAIVTHDDARAYLLPIIQSNQEAMTAVHQVLTQQFQVNELTSLPVAKIPEFVATVDATLAAL